jgi:ubiquinone/menaquinone biosynthesis C-methylase UbiE
MPINEKQTSGEVIFQRTNYQVKGISRWYWDFKDNVLLKTLSQNDQVIYDIGCGEGIFLEKLCKYCPNCQVTGLDYMDENIAICKEHNLPVVKGDIYALEIEDNTIDVVFLNEVIEHLVDPQKALSELYRVLKPGGKLVILFPHDFVFAVARLAFFRIREFKMNPGHVKKWTPLEINKYLKKLNFKVIENRSLPFFFWIFSLHGLSVSMK